MRNIYGVFNGSKWGVTTKLSHARAYVKANPGAEIRRMSLSAWRDAGGWDSPTFYALSAEWEPINRAA